MSLPQRRSSCALLTNAEDFCSCRAERPSGDNLSVNRCEAGSWPTLHILAATSAARMPSAASPVSISGARDHDGPVTPVTSDAVAAPVQVKESMPMSERNLVGAVVRAVTRIASAPTATTVNWR